jgi:cytochrome c oxidase cbb3-type subunit I/II
MMSSQYVQKISTVRPYSPLELMGRDIYVREGCYLCHSQQVRPMAHEVLRYGKASEAGEFIYDHPFQWGSKRTGPDLARVGGKYPNMWHYRHMINPRDVTPQSIMPVYKFLAENKMNFDVLPAKMRAMKQLGVPYSDKEITEGIATAQAQAKTITEDLMKSGVPKEIEDRELVSLIAYLQRIGVDYGSSDVAAPESKTAAD